MTEAATEVMRLSDAMRLADEMGIPDARGVWISRYLSEWVGEKPASCAIGGANIAAGHIQDIVIDGQVAGHIRATQTEGFAVPRLTTWLRCPGRKNCAGVRTNAYAQLRDLIAHLYDVHVWSRTRIANWVDTLGEAR